MHINSKNRLVSTIRSYISDFVFKLIKRLKSRRLALMVVNSVVSLMRSPVRFSWDANLGLFVAIEKDRAGELARTSGCNLLRLFQLNMFGVRSRRQRLADSYFLPRISFAPGDVIVDVGANWGDLFGWLSHQAERLTYVAFEPSAKDVEALRANTRTPQASLVKILPVAASDSTGKANLFINSEEGDSSLITPHTGYQDVASVQTVRLDEALQDVPEIKLLKVEAEGFEPEVLMGCSGILERVKYLALDGGPERGPKEDTTVEFGVNFLSQIGFEVIKLDVSSGMGRVLFRNTHLGD